MILKIPGRSTNTPKHPVAHIRQKSTGTGPSVSSGDFPAPQPVDYLSGHSSQGKGGGLFNGNPLSGLSLIFGEGKGDLHLPPFSSRRSDQSDIDHFLKVGIGLTDSKKGLNDTSSTKGT